jgi:uncharacterized Zn finger protein (UPF0148 family)
MPQFVCHTCGASLYSAAPLTRCAWCGTLLTSEEADEPARPEEPPGDEDDD